MPNEDYPIDRIGKLWDRIWRGRSSSHRRNLSNVALEASRFATLVREAARAIDEIRGPGRAAEILGICDEIAALRGHMRDVEEHLRDEARSG